MTFEDVKRIRKNPIAESCDIQELHNLIDIAIEKQIPKKPITKETTGTMYECKCPDCKCSHREYYPFRFCNHCGQALDWGDSE